MLKVLRFILFTLCFALFVQTFYPAYQININLSEIVENTEDSTQGKLKKAQLYLHENNLESIVIVRDKIDLNLSDFQENLQMQYYRDIWLRPPRI